MIFTEIRLYLERPYSRIFALGKERVFRSMSTMNSVIPLFKVGLNSSFPSYMENLDKYKLSQYYLLFSSSNNTIYGSVFCSASRNTPKVKFNITLNEGWNLVRHEIDIDKNGQESRIVSSVPMNTNMLLTGITSAEEFSAGQLSEPFRSYAKSSSK